MNTKALYAAIAVIALLIVGLFVYNQSQNSNTDELSNQEQLTNTNTQQPSNENSNTSANANTSANSNTTGRFSDETDVIGEGKVVPVSYDGAKFIPSQLTINSGDTVVFKNDSTKSFWPASGPHPTHTLYPEFDAKRAIAPGGTFSFTFLKVGTWPFHDHLNSTVSGSITVK